ncbi:MAG: hypothetical protein HN377_13720, partial [Alphaproteobacteria bacterium]|nr:hypothetical protein [Alphaproteobacteria bacterium]
KARHRLADIVDRYADGRRVENGRTSWLCPIHKEKTPSFSLIPNSDRFICFGCGNSGDLFDFLKLVEGLDLPEAITFLDENIAPSTPIRKPAAPRHTEDQARCTKIARDIWKDSEPAQGTPVERYLRGRGITIPIPRSIRYHPNLVYKPSGLMFDAMVVAVQGPDRIGTGIHRTYLRVNPDGVHKAGVSNPKKTLGPIGDGAARLGPAGAVLGLAEGVETALSAMEIFTIPCWVALGSRLDRVCLPEEVKEVVLFADNGAAGTEAAKKAVEVFTNTRKVSLRCPPDNFEDWNAAIQNRTASDLLLKVAP